jgi:hypothetical protein
MMYKQSIRTMLDDIEDERLIRLIYHFLMSLTKHI